MNENKQIKIGAIMSYAAILFNITAGLIYTPWMIRQIGRSQYGLYVLALSVIGFFMMDFGLGSTVSRFISRYNAEGEKEKASNFLGITFKLYIIIDVAIFLVMLFIFIFAGNIYAKLTPEELSQFKVVFIIASLSSIAAFPFMPLNGILISHERFVFIKFADMLCKMLAVASIIVVLLLGYGLYALVVVNAVTALITIALKLSYLLKNRLLAINFKSKDKTILRLIFHYSAWATIMAVSGRLILNITPTILGVFAGTVQISLFAIAMTIEGYTWTFANALNGLFLPKVTRMTVNSNNPKNVEDLMIRVGRIQLVTTGLLVIGFLTMGKEFMIVWLGDGFKESYYIAMLLMGTGIVTFTQEIGGTMLMAVNKIRYQAFCTSTSAVISIFLSLVLSRLFGAIGSGIAIFSGLLIGNVIGMNLVYYKVLRINIFRFFKECHLKMTFPIIMAFIVGFLLQYLIPVQSLPLFLVKACIFGIIYLILMWFTALNQYEKKLFTGILQKVKS